MGKVTATQSQKPSQNLVEGIFDALLSFRQCLLAPFSTHQPTTRAESAVRSGGEPLQRLAASRGLFWIPGRLGALDGMLDHAK